jgi:hypothetical protein
MALDLGPKLETALRDTSNAVWGASEIDDILALALEETNRVRPRVVKDVVTIGTGMGDGLEEGEDQFTLTNVYTVFRIDLLDENDKVVMPLPSGAWEVWGDNMSSGQTIYVNPSYVRNGMSFRVHGYGPYDTTNTPPAQVQEAILALARAEAYRRVAGERARFEQYASGNPRSDVSVNEILGQVNEADAEAHRLLGDIKLIRRPLPGRF